MDKGHVVVELCRPPCILYRRHVDRALNSCCSVAIPESMYSTAQPPFDENPLRMELTPVRTMRSGASEENGDFSLNSTVIRCIP